MRFHNTNLLLGPSSTSYIHNFFLFLFDKFLLTAFQREGGGVGEPVPAGGGGQPGRRLHPPPLEGRQPQPGMDIAKDMIADARFVRQF